MHPFWWLAPPPSPRRGDFILRYALSEGIALRSFIVHCAHPAWDVQVGRSKAPSLPIKSLSFCLPTDTAGGGRWCRKAPKGGKSHRRWLIIVMLIMPSDPESQSRNADFILIARRAIRNPRPEGPSNLRTLRPSGRSILRTFTPKVCPRQVHLKNLPWSGCNQKCLPYSHGRHLDLLHYFKRTELGFV